MKPSIVNAGAGQLPTRYAVGLAIKVAREAKGISASDLSKAVGMHPSSLSRTESGQRSLEFVEALRISDVLEIDLERFVKLALSIDVAGVVEKRDSLKAAEQEIAILAE